MLLCFPSTALRWASTSCAQARARSLAGFSEDAGEGKDDGDSVSRRSYADDCDEHDGDEEEEELLELTEQDLLRMLDAQEPSLQARCRCCSRICTGDRSIPAQKHWCWSLLAAR